MLTVPIAIPLVQRFPYLSLPSFGDFCHTWVLHGLLFYNDFLIITTYFVSNKSVKKNLALLSVTQLAGTPSPTPKGHGFDPWSGGV